MANNQINEPRRPWYVRYHIAPDPKKPRTAVMSIVHGYVYFWLGLWIVLFAVGGLAILLTDQSVGSVVLALICFGAAYGGYWYLKRERARDQKRRDGK